MQVEKDLRVGFILLCPVTPETQGKLLSLCDVELQRNDM